MAAENDSLSSRKTEIVNSVESHLMAFAADESRKRGSPVNFGRFKRRVMRRYAAGKRK
jgi:hypothetical protein